MEESFGDRHDDTVYFIMEYKAEIASRSLIKLQRLVYFFAAVYLLFMVYAYVMVKSFVLHPQYFLVPLYLITAWKIADLLRGHDVEKIFQEVRIFAFVFFIGLSVLVVYIDAITYVSSPVILVPILILVIPAFYTDYLIALIILEAAIFIVFLVLSGLIRGIASLPEGSCLCLVAASIAMYSYWVILCEYTNNAFDKRVLKDEGSKDLLTGLLNKVSFEREVKAYLSSRLEDGKGVLMIIDFDNFKRVNDNYGHLIGDEVLKKFGAILKKNFRDSDFIGRIGGDEFMVLMTGNVPDEIVDMRCGNIERELQTTQIGEAGGFSCSIGVAIDRSRFNFDELYLFADDALYEAKERGKATFVKRDANPGEKPPEHKE